MVLGFETLKSRFCEVEIMRTDRKGGLPIRHFSIVMNMGRP